MICPRELDVKMCFAWRNDQAINIHEEEHQFIYGPLGVTPSDLLQNDHSSPHWLLYDYMDILSQPALL